MSSIVEISLPRSVGLHVVEKDLSEVSSLKDLPPVFYSVAEINDCVTALLDHGYVGGKPDRRRLSAVVSNVDSCRDFTGGPVAMSWQ